MEKRFLREKVQRKILITCIGIGMIASLLTGCGSKGSDSSTYSTEETMAVADQSGVETKSTDAGIVAQEPATNEMAKMGKNEMVKMETLVRICKALDCQLDDVVEI